MVVVVICFAQRFRVRLFDDVSDVGSAAIVLGGGFHHKFDEQFTNICFHILVI